MPVMKFNVILEDASEGGFTVRCVEIPGAISEGDTREQAMANIVDAIESILEVRREAAQRDAQRPTLLLEQVAVNAYPDIKSRSIGG